VRLGRLRQRPAQRAASTALVAAVQLEHGGVAGAVVVSVAAKPGAGVRCIFD